jgi:antitoxin (DNA-binding transcriptional repressor) of toxin-antitoxin stability system
VANSEKTVQRIRCRIVIILACRLQVSDRRIANQAEGPRRSSDSRGQISAHSFTAPADKNKPSEYVRLAARGETVYITDRDTVVAKIVTPHPSRSPLLADAWLCEMGESSHKPLPRMPLHRGSRSYLSAN